MRHTFASLESKAGMESTGLAQLMGHTTTRTLTRYVYNTREHHREMLENLEARLEKVLVPDASENKTRTKSCPQSALHNAARLPGNFRMSDLMRMG